MNVKFTDAEGPLDYSMGNKKSNKRITNTDTDPLCTAKKCIPNTVDDHGLYIENTFY